MVADSGQSLPAWQPPTRRSSMLFAAKAMIFRLKRGIQNLVAGPPRLSKAERADLYVVAGSVTRLWSDETPSEHVAQLGKIQNLRVACRALDGIVVPAGTVFSIWRHLGPPITARGYVPGRMLQQGCMMMATGGGLCQLSNALYDAALQAGCQIIERHPHSRIVPGSAAAEGRDATIAWNYVDLRFAPTQELQIYARLDAENLVVRLISRENSIHQPQAQPQPAVTHDPARSCGSCGEENCFRHEPVGAQISGRRAFLVNEGWPEFQEYVQASRKAEDLLGLPLDGRRWKLARYSWRTEGFRHVAEARIATLRRALALRGAGPQGAVRRHAEILAAERIAFRLARLLTPDVTAVTVAQSYLPFLWRDGHLGGRRVSVLMNRLPAAELHARLDAALAVHPDRATLGDFRAPSWLVHLETEALSYADEIVTPHAEIAALFPGRSARLSWRRPAGSPVARDSGRRIVFPGPTIARKGAHAVRDAVMALGLQVSPLGSELEGADFWAHAQIARIKGWENVAAVVQPSLVEDQPRHLLAALAAGVPVIATSACGLDPQPGLVLIPPDDSAALIAALEAVIRL